MPMLHAIRGHLSVLLTHTFFFFPEVVRREDKFEVQLLMLNPSL